MKKMFIVAYVWMYGETKSRAEYVYKTAPKSYISALVDCYKAQSGLAFWND